MLVCLLISLQSYQKQIPATKAKTKKLRWRLFPVASQCVTEPVLETDPEPRLPRSARRGSRRAPPGPPGLTGASRPSTPEISGSFSMGSVGFSGFQRFRCMLLFRDSVGFLRVLHEFRGCLMDSRICFMDSVAFSWILCGFSKDSVRLFHGFPTNTSPCSCFDFLLRLTVWAAKSQFLAPSIQR